MHSMQETAQPHPLIPHEPYDWAQHEDLPSGSAPQLYDWDDPKQSSGLRTPPPESRKAQVQPGSLGGHLILRAGETEARLAGTNITVPLPFEVESTRSRGPSRWSDLTEEEPSHYVTSDGIHIYGSPVIAAMAICAVRYAHQQASNVPEADPS